MEERNDIVIYKSEDGLVKMEAMVDPAGETIWATQKAIAALFGVTVPNISYHLGRIFKSGELEADAVVKEILITAQSGARGISDEKVRYYNLDAIISIGYKVNSIRATKFRIWAANVIKQYMLKGYAVDRNAGAERVRELGITCCGDNLILKNPAPRYEKPCKPVGGGWLCNTCSDTGTKYAQITEISKRLNLDLDIVLI